jgi:hypothetical protein
MTQVDQVPQFSNIAGLIRYIADVRVLTDHPHIHFHKFADDQVEVCCHGCGKSIMASIDSSRSSAYSSYCDQFADTHKKCHTHIPGNLDYSCACPDFRTQLFQVDLREENNPLTDSTGLGNTAESSGN